MKIVLKLITLFIISICFTNNSLAQQPVKLLLVGGVEFGGDEVVRVEFVDGGDQTIDAGQGGFIDVGFLFQPPTIDFFHIRGTVGYKYVTTAANNANITLTRFPIALSGNFMVTDDIRLGLGYVAHTNIKFNADGLGEDFSFDDANGLRFEVAYKWFGLSFTAMDYTDDLDIDYNANSIGFNISGTLF